MVRRNELFGVLVVIIVCASIIAISQIEAPSNVRRTARYQPIVYEDLRSIVQNSSTTQHEVIEQQRLSLKRQLQDYKFTGFNNLGDLTLRTGGNPIRTIIVTTWRSGSTFLGEILNAVPGNFYHYEPLLDYDIVQIREIEEANDAIERLKSLFFCDYTNLQNYLQYGMKHQYLFTHNTRLWNKCEMNPKYCWDPNFLNEFCSLFPFQSMKTVRLRLKLVTELLEDETLNLKVLLLIRDPRATIQSRKHRDWCPGVPDCDQPRILCRDMVSDYDAAIELQEKYPQRFRALRYEDFSLNLTDDNYKTVRDLFKFLGLQFHSDVKQYLDSHTRINAGGVSSTFRDTKRAPFHWTTELNTTEIRYIEDNCVDAMKLWGYNRLNINHPPEWNDLILPFKLPTRKNRN